MQDVDDFDPLDDILLSDDEPPKLNVPSKNVTTFQNAEDIDFNDEYRKKKKKKMLAELFSSNEESKVEENPIASIESTFQKKSDWLDLKDYSSQEHVSTDISFSLKKNENELHKDLYKTSVTSETTLLDADLGSGAKTVHFIKNDSISNRRKSESSPATDLQKSKFRFKSLDLNDDFDFDSESQVASLPQTTNIPTAKSSKDDEMSYVPSSGLTRRSVSSKARLPPSDRRSSSFLLDPEIHQKTNLDLNRDILPSWLEPKNEARLGISASKSIPKPTTPALMSSVIGSSSNVISSGEKDTEVDDESIENQTLNNVNENESSNFVSIVSELVKKQENLKQTAKSQVQNLSVQERKIRDSAWELMKQQRDSIKKLIQILSDDDVLHETGPESSKVSHVDSENTLSQLQKKLVQLELEKAEFEIQLKHAELKYKIDSSMLEDLYKYKLQIAEERETYYKNEIISQQEEFDAKLSKRKETEEELMRTSNEKIRALQEDHLNEMKRIIEFHNLKSAMGLNKGERKDAEDTINKELTLREIATEEKQKQLMEFEERLNREKVAMEARKISFETRIEEFELKIAKETLNVEQQKKDLKLSQNIFAEKEMYWEREREREQKHISSCKKELESLKENLLIEERKLIKEKFEITAAKARLDAVMTSESDSGQIEDVIQTRAELHGTIEEIRRLKSKLESERNEIKKEEMRLKEESWRLKNIEQDLSLRHKNFQKLVQEVELKRDEGLQALKKAKLIESQMNERVENVEKRMTELNHREELLTKEKIEISKERDLLNKKKYQLDMVLPQLSYDEQLPYNLLNKNLLDPRIMIMKLKAENDFYPL